MPPLRLNAPTIVHHMAALDGSDAPPNSLAAIQACLQAGAAIVEVDVTALAQGDYLLVHDAQLETETSGQGAVAECAPDQARALSIKQRGKITSYPVALLSDAVRLFVESNGSTQIQLDFKNAIPFTSPEPLERLVRLIQPLKARVIVSSGADWQLRRLRKLAPWLMLGFDVMWYIAWQPDGHPRDPRDFPKHLGAYGYYDDHLLASGRYYPAAEYLRDRCEGLLSQVPDASVFYLEHHLIAQSLADGFNWAEALHAHDIRLNAWTMDVTHPQAVLNAPRLLAAGVDLFTTNTPLAMQALLSGRTT